jgi:addiction module RelE/StbE family toxin
VAKVVWTDQALDDLDSITLFIARDSAPAARFFGRAVFEATERLEAFPLSGRSVPELRRDDMREVIVQSYRIIYRVQGGTVELITIHHGARRLPDLNI